MAALCAVPTSVITQLRAGNPHWSIDAHLRSLVSSMGKHGMELRSSLVSARARIWHSQRFPNQDPSVFNGIRAKQP